MAELSESTGASAATIRADFRALREAGIEIASAGRPALYHLATSITAYTNK